ncbi:FecR domain-containing protein [Porticoccaceae bacterium LTM1]|nr:FecR domain-containing protein [Porticoccaceae bacterium LTM1]
MIDSIKEYQEESRALRDALSLVGGELSREEAENLKTWRRGSESYRESFSESVELLGDVESLAGDADFMKQLDDALPHRVSSSSNRNGRKQVAVWAAAAVLVVTCFIVFQTNYQGVNVEQNISRYVTRVGEQKTIDLDDGSQVVLNTATQLLVDYSSSARRIVLERGEAYFDVAKDSTRPFSIELGDQEVTVLGTAFSIWRQPEQFTLAVSDGVVAIHRRSDSVVPGAPILEPRGEERVELPGRNQRRVSAGTVVEFFVDQQKLVAYHSEDIDQIQDWRTGMIHFENSPLDQVVRELNRYSGKKILIEDRSIMGLELYATVKVDHINEALFVIEQALPINVMHHFDRIVLTRK